MEAKKHTRLGNFVIQVSGDSSLISDWCIRSLGCHCIPVHDLPKKLLQLIKN